MNDVERDARRYRRLQVIGCAVMNTARDAGLVSRFSNLDAVVDADLRAQPNRGEADPVLDSPASGGNKQKDVQITELQNNCKKFRDEAIVLRTAPAVLAHVLRRCMQKLEATSALYKDCVTALAYSQPDVDVISTNQPVCDCGHALNEHTPIESAPILRVCEAEGCGCMDFGPDAGAKAQS